MKKIMFNDKYGLTQAVLDGRKTQTRRLIPQSIMNRTWAFREEYYGLTMDYLQENELFEHYFFTEKREKLPYNIGEIVAIAQSYSKCGCLENGIPRWDIIAVEVGATNAGWGNKMLVKPELMPHQIRIVKVRAERLQDISDEDCMAEGIFADSGDETYFPTVFFDFDCNTDDGFDTPQEAFASLIDKVSGKGTWDSDPYVFVYEFELVK